MSIQSIDLSLLPAPSVVEPLDFETILATIKADLLTLAPEMADVLSLESEPVTKLCQVLAYRELLLRQRVNEACRAVMLAFAKGADLDQVGANLQVQRLLVTEADETTIPPTAAVYEGDEPFRERIALSLEGYTTAGSEGSYVFHALSADARVRSVTAVSPDPGVVIVYVLSTDGDGTADQDLLDAVAAYVNAESVRPLTDRVTVMSASVVPYTIEAELVLYPGPATDVVLETARAAAQAYADSMHRNGYDVALSGIYQALHVAGAVQRVNLTMPAANIATSAGQAAYCTGITLTVAGARNE